MNELETMNRKGNARAFYKNVKRQRNGFQARSTKIKDKEGHLISYKECIASRWKEYFHELLNRPVTADRRTSTYHFEEPLIKEVITAINKLKNQDVPGEDNIPAEKHGGPELWNRLHQIIVKVWEDENLSEEWLMGFYHTKF